MIQIAYSLNGKGLQQVTAALNTHIWDQGVEITYLNDQEGPKIVLSSGRMDISWVGWICEGKADAKTDV